MKNIDMKLALEKFDWKQIDGDIDPGTYGGLIATCDGSNLEIIEIQPVREYVGNGKAKEVGYPFWTKEAYFDLDDLDPNKSEVQLAMKCCDLQLEFLYSLKPHERSMAIATALVNCGHGDEGQGGWSEDIIHHPVKWWGKEKPVGHEYLSDEDEEFTDNLLEEIRREIVRADLEEYIAVKGYKKDRGKYILTDNGKDTFVDSLAELEEKVKEAIDTYANIDESWE